MADLEGVIEEAYGTGVLPREVGTMTPAELVAVVDARQERASIEREYLASLVAAIISPWVRSGSLRHQDLMTEYDRRRTSLRLIRQLSREARRREAEAEG